MYIIQELAVSVNCLMQNGACGKCIIIMLNKGNGVLMTFANITVNINFYLRTSKENMFLNKLKRLQQLIYEINALGFFIYVLQKYFIMMSEDCRILQVCW